MWQQTFSMYDNLRKFSRETGILGAVYWPKGRYVNVPAMSQVVLEAWTSPQPDGKDYVGLVEPAAGTGLPEQLLLARSFSTVAKGRLKVRVVNLAPNSVKLVGELNWE